MPESRPSHDSQEKPLIRRSRFIRWGRRLLITCLSCLLLAMLFTRWVAGTPHVSVPVTELSATDDSEPKAQEELVLMSVNCAHGRGEGWHQALTSTETLQQNCTAIGMLLTRQNADIVCLQECDAPSLWSGHFDHAVTIAKHAKLPRLARALNVDGSGLHYGTGLLSRWKMSDAMAHTFHPTPPTFSKGFVVAAARWPADDSFEFDVVSVHLDFASRSARARQVDELVSVLRDRNRPVILAGDLNSEWAEGAAANRLAAALDVEAFEPHSEMVTFPFQQTRLDWILVSDEFEITAVRAIDAKLSDHCPLRAVIRRR